MDTGKGRFSNNPMGNDDLEMTEENLEAIKRKTFEKIEKEKRAEEKKKTDESK